MKKLIFIILLGALLLIGCEKDQYIQMAGEYDLESLLQMNKNDCNWQLVEQKVSGLLKQNNNGITGYILKEINGPVIIRNNTGIQFEPASSIKAVHLVHTLLQVDAGIISLDDEFEYYLDSSVKDDPETPDMDEREYGCPIDTNPQTDILRNGLKKMMENSDNRWTQAVRAFWGQNALNKTAYDIGMRNTEIRHRIGCGFYTGNDPGLLDAPNQTTIDDLTVLYEKSFTDLLSTEMQDEMYDLMANDIFIRLDEILTEIEKIYSISNEFMLLFRDMLNPAWKAGKYNIYNIKLQSVAGVIGIPFKDGRNIIHKRFIYSIFIDKATIFPEQGTRAGRYSFIVLSEMLKPLIIEGILSFLEE